MTSGRDPKPDGRHPPDAGSERPHDPSEGAAAATPDAVAGLALVRERLARRSQGEQDAFWEAVRRCFAGGAAPPIPEG